MKRLIEKNVIKINYNTFVNQYKKAFKCEKDIIDEELYEHFIINPFTYSRPFGCLLPNYNNTETYYLNGINIFEVVDYVSINERLYKVENSGDNEDDSDQNDESFNFPDNSGNEDTIDYSNSEEEYGNGNKKGKKNKKSNKNSESVKTKGNQKGTNRNINNNNTTQAKKSNNKYRRIFRFLLFDGKYFIYAYEYEYNEIFNYLETNKYKYPKIILYNNPVIKRKVILLKKNQVIILFKGNITTEQNTSSIKDEEECYDIVDINKKSYFNYTNKQEELIPISTKNESNSYNWSGNYNMPNQNRHHNDSPNYLSRENNVRHFYYEDDKFKNTYTNSGTTKDEQNYNNFYNNNNSDKYDHFKSYTPLNQAPNFNENAHNKNFTQTNSPNNNPNRMWINNQSNINKDIFHTNNNNQLIDLTEGFFSSKFFQKSPDISNTCDDVIILDD
ncbi:conserved Plasmodium protein, unknown function [Plasmodium vinckei vinckei]|uniref:RecQ mediated genome instability protein 1 OB-fold domain-containing protein n=1 Tax=Plasmodium vinckei vinckei TaxID=54757 RepID=A0A449BW86_PLAVN|nr:conserved Plasmodium protein, unknown function [Plasmodium vinckei vinckei]KEG03456.1 hypothetical protein YYE_01480 [Plasmodium vinckei vinckei]VEV57747.1 conserved Plasmodium protein, unknown function [Plasmodium vinckei vinckei]